MIGLRTHTSSSGRFAWGLGLCLASAALLGACATAASGTDGSGAQLDPTASATADASAAPLPGLTPAPPALGGVTWRPAGSLVRGVPAVFFASVKHMPVTLMWLNPELLSFRYIPGYEYPEHGPVLPADHRPATWVPRMVAAFNGGFHLADNVGGYYYDGRLVKQMRSNYGAFSIDAHGHIRVGVWSPGVRIPSGTRVVRQNLPLLISEGKSQAKPTDGVSTWGIVTYRRPQANRSALGQLADGSLVFAVGHETTAAVLGSVMSRAGVRTAVMLDMNGSWPTGFVYDHRARMSLPIGRKISSTIVRPPSTYFAPFKKDFVVALMP